MQSRARGALQAAAQATWRLWTALPLAVARAALDYGLGSAVLLKTAATLPPGAPPDEQDTPDPRRRAGAR